MPIAIKTHTDELAHIRKDWKEIREMVVTISGYESRKTPVVPAGENLLAPKLKVFARFEEYPRQGESLLHATEAQIELVKLNAQLNEQMQAIEMRLQKPLNSNMTGLSLIWSLCH